MATESRSAQLVDREALKKLTRDVKNLVEKSDKSIHFLMPFTNYGISELLLPDEVSENIYAKSISYGRVNTKTGTEEPLELAENISIGYFTVSPEDEKDVRSLHVLTRNDNSIAIGLGPKKAIYYTVDGGDSGQAPIRFTPLEEFKNAVKTRFSRSSLGFDVFSSDFFMSNELAVPIIQAAQRFVDNAKVALELSLDSHSHQENGTKGTEKKRSKPCL